MLSDPAQGQAVSSLLHTTSNPHDNAAGTPLQGQSQPQSPREPPNSEDILRQDWSTTGHDSPHTEDVSQQYATEVGRTAEDDNDFLFDALEDDFGLPTRELRPQRSSNIGFQVPYLDKDETGDFDPYEHERQNRSKRRRPATRAHDQTCEGNQRTFSKSRAFATHGTTAATTQSDPRLIITLSLASEDGRARLRQILSVVVKPAITENKGYALRRRETAEGFGNATTTVDPALDLAGRPAARGCVACFDLQAHCSLLDDETSWPCVTCDEDGNECQLISRPKRFRACVACKRRRTACSYTTTRNHSATCQQCAEFGEQCIAGPAKEFVRHRLRYEQAPEQLGASAVPRKTSNRLTKSPNQCFECHEASRSCLYTPDSDGVFRSGCTHCVEHGLSCTIRGKVNDSPMAGHEGDEDNVHSCDHVLSPKTEPDPRNRSPIPKDQLSQPGKAHTTRWTETSFTYPIIFNCDDPQIHSPSPTPLAECLFCMSPGAALYGSGIRDVEIIDHPNGAQCHEVVPTKSKSTSLCGECTTTRMRIVACKQHDMRPIVGVYGSAAIDDVFADVAPTRVQELDILCSICPLRGVYECAAAQSRDESGIGCGMKLCEYCALRLDGEYDGRLQDALATLPARAQGSGELQLRADCELLRRQGALYRYLEWMSRRDSCVETIT